MYDYTLTDLGVFICAIIGSVGICLVKVIFQIENSRCSDVNCCCLTLKRNIDSKIELADIESGQQLINETPTPETERII
tara:strand:- start:144 stop:380 length:237 start_codon:yes stop_codon:yes gene_type:complete